MNKSFFVSVIIPTFNRAQWISCAINSVLSQTYSDYEIIVVDDGSTDNTKSVIELYQNPKIKYFFQNNSGVSSARNKGISESSGDWLAFLDSDDEWLPEKLQRQISLLKKYPEVILLLSNNYFINGCHKTTLFEKRNININADIMINEPLGFLINNAFFSSTVMVKKSIISKSGAFDTAMSFSEDLDFIWRTSTQGALGVVYDPLVKIINRGYGDISLSESLDRDLRLEYRSNCRAYQKLLNFSLKKTERRIVKKKLSGARFYLGVEEIKNKNKKIGYYYCLISIVDNFSLISILRVAFLLVFGYKFYMLLIKRIKNKTSFRRSDLSSY